MTRDIFGSISVRIFTIRPLRNSVSSVLAEQLSKQPQPVAASIKNKLATISPLAAFLSRNNDTTGIVHLRGSFRPDSDRD